MKEPITCTQIIRNELSYDWKNNIWIRFDEEERYRIFNLFKGFVAKTARGKRRQRILNAYPSQVKYYGILRRLVYNQNKDRVEYICGQDWNTEMGVLRDAFDR